VEGKDRRLERSVSSLWKADTLNVVPRLCRLSSDGLDPTSNY
jgi:hypothetical protein